MEFTDISILFSAFQVFSLNNLIMILVAGVLIYLAIKKNFEPVLLLPIGFGAILANLPLTGITNAAEGGFLGVLYQAGIKTELFPLLIFIGIGALTDFGPLLENPKMAFLGAAGQVGIFVTLLLASCSKGSFIGIYQVRNRYYIPQQFNLTLWIS